MLDLQQPAAKMAYISTAFTSLVLLFALAVTALPQAACPAGEFSDSDGVCEIVCLVAFAIVFAHSNPFSQCPSGTFQPGASTQVPDSFSWLNYTHPQTAGQISASLPLLVSLLQDQARLLNLLAPLAPGALAQGLQYGA